MYDLYSNETRDRLTERLGDEKAAKALWYDHIEADHDLSRSKANFIERAQSVRAELERAEREVAEAVTPNGVGAFAYVGSVTASAAYPAHYLGEVRSALRRVYSTRRAIQAVLGELPDEA